MSETTVIAQENEKKEKLNLQVYKAESRKELNTLEEHWRNMDLIEQMPFAKNTPFDEICTRIMPSKSLKDRSIPETDEETKWEYPVIYFISSHASNISTKDLLRQAEKWYREDAERTGADVLSISAGMEANALVLKVLLRVYGKFPDIKAFFDSIGASILEEQNDAGPATGHLVIPDEIKNFSYTDEERALHDNKYAAQCEILETSTKKKPFLNQLESYVPSKLFQPEDKIPLVYDLKGKDQSISLLSPYENFQSVFKEVMRFVSGTEYYNYASVMSGEEDEKQFMDYLENHIKSHYVIGEGSLLQSSAGIYSEDIPKLMERVYNALFKLYVVQDLIDDPNVTDVKIVAPDSIRARVKGKAYKSNINFVDEKDYMRFVDGICIRNGISQDTPAQTFTDSHDENYILRFSLISSYVTSGDMPYLHIRKVSRKKMLGDELIEAGMLTPKIRDYLLDCGKNSRGVVFAGPPGSGKTICLNWFLEEAYEQSAEILVIQENDELFCYRDGVMFEHVVNYNYHGKAAVSLEQLGQLALVAGANVFIIGEAKGAEICSAITLSNSGCRTAITIHSPSSTETLDKMADLAMRGYAQDYDQAKRMLKSFQTIVYLQDFKVQEISEIKGFNEKTKDIEYRYIYRRDEEEKAERLAKKQPKFAHASNERSND